MITDKKAAAIKLRRKNKSYNEISRILGISKSTLSDWFKNDKESQKTKLALYSRHNNPVVADRIKKFVKSNKERWEKWREDARIEARKEFVKLSKNPLFIAGVMLYWAEGDGNPKNAFKITNTSPKMISLYTRFLTNVLHIPKNEIRATLILYPDLSNEECLGFWSEVIGIPKLQFWKTQFINGRHPTARLANGICMINCGSRQLKEKVLVWIDLLSKML